ncbi:MAG: hypothetical protein GY710_07505 [Desulfobacteraceae bacterium]|nr:hypothetical protein [Desulfobacteraceae bacterium]
MFKSFLERKLFGKNLRGKTQKLESNKIIPSTRWSLGIYTGNSIYDLNCPGENINPILTVNDIRDEKATLVADPFMIKKEDKWYLFFEAEVKTDKGPVGKIGLTTSPDGLSWTYDRMILEEPFHLSYPHIFNWKNEYYMIPETRSIRAVRLYKAQKFPYKWELEKVLLKGKRFADNSLFQYNKLWWLFTDSGNHTLRLYFSDKPDGKWKEHCKSPIMKKHPSHARPGGRVIILDGTPIRFAQDAYPIYGKQVWAFKITELTPDRYQEKLVENPIVTASGSGWNAKGMHTVDPHRLEDGSWIACVDGLMNNKPHKKA